MKLKKIGVLAFTLLLGITAQPVMAHESVDNCTLPQNVIEIADGSDYIYGEGAPIEHVKNKHQGFCSGGVDHTHQYIVANALRILNNDKGNTILNSNADTICEYTDWPDILGNETDYGTYAGHFYDPDTGKNWLGKSDKTARTRAELYFNSAVASYKAGDIDKAMQNLGKGTHYVSDLNEPHHASNLTAVNSNHTEFENYVDKHRAEYKITGNKFDSSIYDDAVSRDVGDIMYSAAKNAKAIVGEAQDKELYDIAGQKSVQNAITTVTEYIYKFGTQVNIYN